MMATLAASFTTGLFLTVLASMAYTEAIETATICLNEICSFHDSYSLEAFTLLDRVGHVATEAFGNWNRAIHDGVNSRRSFSSGLPVTIILSSLSESWLPSGFESLEH